MTWPAYEYFDEATETWRLVQDDAQLAELRELRFKVREVDPPMPPVPDDPARPEPLTTSERDRCCRLLERAQRCIAGEADEPEQRAVRHELADTIDALRTPPPPAGVLDPYGVCGP